ncbi:MAG: hypothetical protein GY708_15025, partial [Actinomycetia bacterium]|nr:hypothetical protein [Actinomycetes bacterium]
CAGDTLADVMAQGMAEGSTMSDDQANCLAKGILNDREMMIDFLEVGANDAEPGADLLGSFMGLLGDCDVSLGDLG